jgi:hypothetical protein
VLAAGTGLTWLLVSDDDSSTSASSMAEPTDEADEPEGPTHEPVVPSLTVAPPTESAPTPPETEPGGLQQQVYIDVAIDYIEAVRAEDCATAQRLASPLLTSSGKSAYCGDSYTREVLSDFDPSNPKVDMYEIIDTAQITFTWSGSTAFVSLTSTSGEPKVDVLAAY